MPGTGLKTENGGRPIKYTDFNRKIYGNALKMYGKYIENRICLLNFALFSCFKSFWPPFILLGPARAGLAYFKSFPVCREPCFSKGEIDVTCRKPYFFLRISYGGNKWNQTIKKYIQNIEKYMAAGLLVTKISGRKG